MRNSLIDKKILKHISDDVKPEVGDIIEFEAQLKRNPIIETLDSFTSMMELAAVFADKNSSHKISKNNTPNEYQKITKQMAAMADSLKSGDTIDLTDLNLSTGQAAVITVETQFLNDPLMSDLVDGQFKVLGKVIRSIQSPKDSISLIRKTAIGKMPAPMLEKVFGSFSSLGTDSGFNLPQMIWEVKGPAIQILPIAIYA